MRWILLLLLATPALAVQPIPGGIRIQWTGLTNDTSYDTWKLNPGATNWLHLGYTTNWFYEYTNNILPIPDGTMFGVSATYRSNGLCCYATDIGVAAWPPAITTPPNSVRLTPTNGYLVPTGQWNRVSSDLATYTDWMRFTIVSNMVRIEHKASPLRPKMFISYFTVTNPPPLP